MKLVKRRKPKIIRSVRFNKEKDSVNYYREQLMLYSPWRNEEKDLILNFQTYQESFESQKVNITERREQYEYHSELLDKAMQDIENHDNDDFGNVAPNAQHVNEQDKQAEKTASELYGCFDPGKNKLHNQYDLLDDMGMFPRTNDQEDLVVKRMEDHEFRKLVRSLNKKQRQFFYHVLYSIKTKDEPLRLFLTGGAGVGKSTVTNALYEALIKYLNSQPGENPDEIKVLKVAPTGKAAFNIKGNTLHSAFKIPANRGFQYCTLDRDRLNTIRAHLGKLKVIFIDEISMVGSGMFNFLNLRLQQIMGSQIPFGGVSLITVGDFFQLKPVFDKWIFETSKDNYSALAANIWQDHFQMFELTEIMRQKDDKQFAELLNRLREGNHTEHDIKVLKTRILKENPTSINYPMSKTHLFVTNACVNVHNTTIYEKSSRNKAQVKAVDIIVGDVNDALKEKLRKRIPDDPTKTMGLYSEMSVAVGGKYDLTTNVSVLDGMTNGAECIIEKIDYRVANSSRPSIIWVSFSENSIGHNHRKEYFHLYHNNINKSWTPVLEICRQFRFNKKGQTQVLRKQFPLRPAAAKTIHRCQGDTLNEAVVDFPSITREHIHYVGLSRVRNSSTLHILNLNEQKIKVSNSVQTEMLRLRNEASLTCCLPYLYMYDSTKCNSNKITILFHNVRSLHLHIEDVAHDYNVQAANVNIFVETTLCSRDDNNMFTLKDFILYRNDYNPSQNTRTKYGTAVYIKNNIQCLSDPTRCNYNDVEITMTVINYNHHPLYIIGIYRSSSKVTLIRMIEALDYIHSQHNLNTFIPTVILGDFNVNINQSSSEKNALLKYLITEKGYTQLINDYTTDYRTTIDHIYTNIQDQIEISGVLESYYSDHKPLFLQLQ